MFSTRFRFDSIRYGLILLVLAITLVPLNAQEYRAKVQGIVTDPSQAAVPGAKVILINQTTGVSAATESDIHGRYVFNLVVPGTYEVHAEASGFETFELKDVLIQVRADITVDPKLQLKGAASTVTVTDTGTTVQFNSSSVDMTINQTLLKDLPVMARNPFQLATLDPMVVNRYTGAYASANANPFFMWSSSTIDVGGSNARQNDLYVDGTPVQVGPKGSYTPPMDAVQEFSVQQNTVDAEYGHSAGGVLSVGMKSGTNEFHGTAYYFGRNPALNAAVNSITHEPSTSRNHIWGATLGNPIVKRKLFMFTSYEQWKMNEPLNNFFTLPTDLERTGDFSQSLNAIGGLQMIYDPWSTVVDPATGIASRTPFPGNKIPSSKLDPTAVRFMKDIWAPNSAGDGPMGLQNFKKTFPMRTQYINLSERVDWNPNDSWRIFGRYSMVDTNLAPERYSGSVAQRDANAGIMNNRNLAVDAVWVKSSSTVYSFRFGYTSLADNYDSPPSQITEAQLAEFWPNNAWYKPYLAQLPQLYYPALYVGDAVFGQDLYWLQTPKHYSGTASVRTVQGLHSLKAGLETRFHVGKVHMPNLMGYGFSPTPTSDTFQNPNWGLTGDSWATFLVGAPEAAAASTIAPQYSRVNFYALYFQDDVKLTRRITLNLGLRYEYEAGPVDPDYRLTRLLDLNNPIPEFQNDPPQFLPAVQALFGKPFIYNGAFYFTDKDNPHKYNSNPHVFLPRIGISMRLSDKMSLRAGWARFVVPPLVVSRTITDDPGYYGYSQTTSLAPTTLGVPGASLSNPFPNLLEPAGNSYGRYTQLGDSVIWDSPTFRTGVNDRMNFSFQRFLGAGFVAEATYFLNVSRGLPYDKNFNLMDPNLLYTYKALVQQPVPNPFYNHYAPDVFPGILKNYPYVPATYQLRPYPQYLDLIQRNTPGIEDHYQALSVALRKQFSQGYQLQWAYAYARQETGVFFNDLDQYADRFTMMDSNNPRHRMTFAGTVELPFGKGRKWGGNSPKFVDMVVGGWSLSPVFMISSGEYLRFGPALVSGDPSIDNPSRDLYFDTSKFQVLPAYTPRMNPWQYDGVKGSRNWNIDLSLAKRFPITEKTALEFRMEAYNLTNSFVPGLPVMEVSSPQFGTSVTQANLGRQLQYTLRLYF
jgi:hypothetical protein